MDYTESDLHYISASEAIAGFQAKELSPVELMQAVIDRIGQVNDQLNCFTYTYFDRAMEQARHNQRKAAELLGLTYHQLRGYLKKYELLKKE